MATTGAKTTGPYGYPSSRYATVAAMVTSTAAVRYRRRNSSAAGPASSSRYPQWSSLWACGWPCRAKLVPSTCTAATRIASRTTGACPGRGPAHPRGERRAAGPRLRGQVPRRARPAHHRPARRWLGVAGPHARGDRRGPPPAAPARLVHRARDRRADRPMVAVRRALLLPADPDLLPRVLLPAACRLGAVPRRAPVGPEPELVEVVTGTYPDLAGRVAVV